MDTVKKLGVALAFAAAVGGTNLAEAHGGYYRGGGWRPGFGAGVVTGIVVDSLIGPRYYAPPVRYYAPPPVYVAPPVYVEPPRYVTPAPRCMDMYDREGNFAGTTCPQGVRPYTPQ